MSEKGDQFAFNVEGGNNTVTTNENVGLAAIPIPVAAIPIPTPNVSMSGSLLDLMQPLVDIKEIQFKEKVGHGSYGVVYKAVWHDRLVAVKEFEPNSDLKAIETEVKQLSRVSHHNIISLFGISTNKQSKYLIMEYAEGGSLHNFLHGKVKPFYSTAHGMSWASQCAEGVAYLHAMKPKPLIHRDLKPLNLLLTNKGRLLKICDFGTVADKSTLMTNNKGSAAWMAPEVFVGSKYTEKCDVFSWAIVLWEVLSRQRPFKEADNNYAIMWKIHKGERPPPIKDCPDQITKLMTSCWSNAPESRPSMQFVVSIMNELSSHFQGALEPLNYAIVDQQIICTNSNSNTFDKYTLDFSSLNTSSSNCERSLSSQVTATNKRAHINDCINSTQINADNINTTNSPNDIPIYPITSQWDFIVEESETSNPTAAIGQMTTDPFKLQPSQETIGRYKIIQKGVKEMSHMLMSPLAVEVDSNAWDLTKTDFNILENNDGDERFKAYNTKQVLPFNTTKIIINSSNTNKTDAITNLINNEEDDDEEEIDGSTMLDPELQPESLICGNSESEQIYREHQRLATEYLLVDTKLSYAQVFKENLLAEMNPIERQRKQELLKKINEKEDLLELYTNLKQQMEEIGRNPFDNCSSETSIGNATGGEVVADDGWVMIPPQQNI